MDDQRKFERFGISVPAKIEIQTPRGRKEHLEAETENLSATGTLFRLTRPLPEGARVRVEIVLDFEELKAPGNIDGLLVMQLTGRTLRSGTDGLAIRFDEDSASFATSPSDPD